MLSADGHYTPAIDIWSVGCILAELLGRGPLFAGKDFMETIKMQIDVLGTRPDDELTYIRSQQALDFLNSIPKRATVPWKTLYADASDKVLDLLDQMLQFSAAKRISICACRFRRGVEVRAASSRSARTRSLPRPAANALAHPFFDSVRNQYTFEDPALPTGAGGFEFSFESAQLTAADFRRLIVEEAASFRAERALARRLREDAGGSGSGAAIDVEMSGVPAKR